MQGRSFEQVIRRGDYFRRPPLRVAGRDDFKEWVHFCCVQGEFVLLVNFSLTGCAERETARLVCAVKAERWDGDVETFALQDVQVEAGGTDIVMGVNSARFHDGCYRVVGALARRALRFDLVIRPRAMPFITHNVGLHGGSRLHWFAVPALHAEGHVEVGGQHIQLNEAPCYHDRNWGTFRWGRGTSWIWGYAHGRSGAESYTLTFDRLTNHTRTSDLGRALLLWRDGEQQRMFTNDEISIVQRGMLRRPVSFRLPRIGRLLRPEQALEVPEELWTEARAGIDWVRVCFRPREVCQILVPNDDDLEFTVINEVHGDVSVRGEVHGRSFEFTATTLCEFLHA